MTSYYQKLSLFSCWNCHLWFPWIFHNRTVMYGSADALCRLPLFLHRWISVFEIWASNISLVYRFIQLMFIIVWTTGIWMRWHVYTFRWMPSRITLVKQRGIYYTSSLEEGSSIQTTISYLWEVNFHLKMNFSSHSLFRIFEARSG